MKGWELGTDFVLGDARTLRSRIESGLCLAREERFSVIPQRDEGASEESRWAFDTIKEIPNSVVPPS